jgi:hypothetical protein
VTLATAPDSGYAPTSVELYMQGIDAENTSSDILRVTVPYGGTFCTDQFVADVQAAMATAVLAAYPGGTVSLATLTYIGQATVTTTDATSQEATS